MLRIPATLLLLWLLSSCEQDPVDPSAPTALKLAPAPKPPAQAPKAAPTAELRTPPLDEASREKVAKHFVDRLAGVRIEIDGSPKRKLRFEAEYDVVKSACDAAQTKEQVLWADDDLTLLESAVRKPVWEETSLPPTGKPLNAKDLKKLLARDRVGQRLKEVQALLDGGGARLARRHQLEFEQIKERFKAPATVEAYDSNFNALKDLEVAMVTR